MPNRTPAGWNHGIFLLSGPAAGSYLQRVSWASSGLGDVLSVGVGMHSTNLAYGPALADFLDCVNKLIADDDGTFAGANLQLQYLLTRQLFQTYPL